MRKSEVVDLSRKDNIPLNSIHFYQHHSVVALFMRKINIESYIITCNIGFERILYYLYI